MLACHFELGEGKVSLLECSLTFWCNRRVCCSSSKDVEKLCARCAVAHEEFGETPTNGQKYNPEDKPGNCGGAEFLDETVRQTEYERRRDKWKKVESEDIQGPLKNDDADNPEEDREYADEYNGMGHSRADVKKDPSGKNKEEQMGTSVD